MEALIARTPANFITTNITFRYHFTLQQWVVAAPIKFIQIAPCRDRTLSHLVYTKNQPKMYLVP